MTPLFLFGGGRLRHHRRLGLLPESRSRLRRLRSVFNSRGGLVAEVAVFFEGFVTRCGSNSHGQIEELILEIGAGRD